MLTLAVALESEVHMQVMLPQAFSAGMWRAAVALESSACPGFMEREAPVPGWWSM